MKVELGGKIMTKFVGLRGKSCSYLIDDGSEDKNAKVTQKCVIKSKLKLQDYKNCLEAAQIENKINQIEKNKTDVDSLKEIIRNSKSMLKTQRRFESKRHNVFTEEINKIAVSSNDEKKVQSIDLIGTYEDGTSKDLVSEKENVKCSNTIK